MTTSIVSGRDIFAQFAKNVGDHNPSGSSAPFLPELDPFYEQLHQIIPCPLRLVLTEVRSLICNFSTE